MPYSSIISRESAKTYLGLDDDSRNSEVDRMILAAFKYVEKYTNHIFNPTDKAYLLTNGCVRIYDHPINTESDNLESLPLYSIYTDKSATSVVLSVGYTDSDDIPEDLLETVYMVLKYLFYEQEGSGKIPMGITTMLDLHKRFII